MDLDSSRQTESAFGSSRKDKISKHFRKRCADDHFFFGLWVQKDQPGGMQC
jgi:hypothetical protein